MHPFCILHDPNSIDKLFSKRSNWGFRAVIGEQVVRLIFQQNSGLYDNSKVELDHKNTVIAGLLWLLLVRRCHLIFCFLRLRIQETRDFNQCAVPSHVSSKYDDVQVIFSYRQRLTVTELMFTNRRERMVVDKIFNVGTWLSDEYLAKQLLYNPIILRKRCELITPEDSIHKLHWGDRIRVISRQTVTDNSCG